VKRKWSEVVRYNYEQHFRLIQLSRSNVSHTRKRLLFDGKFREKEEETKFWSFTSLGSQHIACLQCSRRMKNCFIDCLNGSVFCVTFSFCMSLWMNCHYSLSFSEQSTNSTNKKSITTKLRKKRRQWIWDKARISAGRFKSISLLANEWSAIQKSDYCAMLKRRETY
jgi:hypothetical protein